MMSTEGSTEVKEISVNNELVDDEPKTRLVRGKFNEPIVI